MDKIATVDGIIFNVIAYDLGEDGFVRDLAAGTEVEPVDAGS